MLGPRLYRPRTRRPWRFLTLGLAMMGVPGLLSSGWLPVFTDAVRQECRCWMPVGYPWAEPDEHDPDTLLLRADAAMYEVKRQGRDRMTRTVPC